MSVSRTLSLACLALAATAPAVPADVTNAQYSSDNQFVYELIHMPDLDQRRRSGTGVTGLPNDGNFYCVPTATLNMILYAANHGFPEIAPGPANWQLGSNYNTAGTEIGGLGLVMGTGPTTGTNGSGWYYGTLFGLGSNKLVVSQYSCSGGYSPRFVDMAKAGMNGHLVAFAYGRYDVTGSVGPFPVIDRDGGHCVTLAKAAASGASKQVWCRDPAAPDDGALFGQSTFANRQLSVSEQIFWQGGPRVMDALDWNPSSNRHAILDQYLSIRTKAGYSFVNTPTGPSIRIIQPWGFSSVDLGPVTELELANLNVSDVLICPDLTSIAVLTDPPDIVVQPSLKIMEILNGDCTEEIPMPFEVQEIVFGRKRELYVATNDQLMMMDLMQDDPVVAVRDLPFAPDAIAYDDAEDEIIALSLSDLRLACYREGLTAPPTIIPIPLPDPLMGEASMAVSPDDGKIWVFNCDGGQLHGVDVSSPFGLVTVQSIVDPAIQEATSFDFDDAGNFFFSVPTTAADGTVQNEIVAMSLSSAGDLQPVEVDDWRGHGIGPVVRMFKSRTNFDDTMTGPAFDNIDPSELGFLAAVFQSFCNGDGGDQMGCSDCPCGNNSPQGTPGGCLNESGTSAELLASGYPRVTSDSLRFELTGANPGTFGVLISGDERAPANSSNPCFGLGSGITASAFNGLRCVVQGVQRHGSRATDTSGDIGLTNNGWGTPSGPAGGLIAQGGFSAGQTRHYQTIYRENASTACLADQNTSQGVTVTFQP